MSRTLAIKGEKVECEIIEGEGWLRQDVYFRVGRCVTLTTFMNICSLNVLLDFDVFDSP